MGRVSIFVLLFLVVALALRVLFLDSGGEPELEPLAAPHPGLELPASAAPKPPAVIDPDPDLDQPLDTPECETRPEAALPGEMPLAVPPR